MKKKSYRRPSDLELKLQKTKTGLVKLAYFQSSRGVEVAFG